MFGGRAPSSEPARQRIYMTAYFCTLHKGSGGPHKGLPFGPVRSSSEVLRRSTITQCCLRRYAHKAGNRA